MKTDDRQPTIEAAMAELRKAREAYNEAKQNLDGAQRVETSARNALNQAQKRFDEAAESVRKDAPWNTDWHTRSRPVSVTI